MSEVRHGHFSFYTWIVVPPCFFSEFFLFFLLRQFFLCSFFSVIFCSPRLQMASFRSPLSPVAAAAKIFQHRIGDGQRSGWKFLNRTPALSDAISEYYPRPFDTYRFPDFVSQDQATKYWRRQRRLRKGKPSVKKGQGKRAKKAAKSSSKKD